MYLYNLIYYIYIYICRVRAARDCTPKYHHYINNLWQSNVIDISFLQSNVMNPPEGPMASILTGPKGICGPPQHRGMGPWWKRTIGWSPICQSPFSWWNLCVACGLELQHRFVTQSVWQSFAWTCGGAQRMGAVKGVLLVHLFSKVRDRWFAVQLSNDPWS